MDTKQLEAIRIAEWLEGIRGNTWPSYIPQEAAAELRRLQSENEQLRAGYDAARLEVASLRAQLKAVATPAQPLHVAATSCPHEIDKDKIVLHFDSKQPGKNALAQLAARLQAALASVIEGVGRAALAAPAQAGEYPPSSADMVMAALDTGEWCLERMQHWHCLTDEGNREGAWLVKRQKAPYCADKPGALYGPRSWSGPTALDALQKAADDLGIRLPQPAARGAAPSNGALAAPAQPVAWALQWPDDSRLNISTVFDTQLEATEYLKSCSDGVVVVPLYAAPQQAAHLAAKWQLVPRQLTQDMAEAAKFVDGRLSVFKYADAYRAMLYAAPQPAAQDAPVDAAVLRDAERWMKLEAEAVRAYVGFNDIWYGSAEDLRHGVDQFPANYAARAAQKGGAA